MKYKGSILLLLISVVVGGCAWVPARNESQGHIYPATSLTTALITCGTKESVQEKDLHFLIKALALPQAIAYSLVVEMPVSLAIDTILLPLDLSQEQKEPRKSVKYYCDRMSEDLSKRNQQPKKNHDNANLAK